MRHPAFAAIALPALVVAALSGCTPPTGSPTTPPAPSGLAGCVTGHTWNLDVNDAASQISDRFTTLGLPVTSVTGTGTETMKWDADGKTVIETNLAYEITVQENPTNTLVITQTNRGPAHGIFTIDGTKAIPTDWDSSGYTSVNSTSVNGVPGGESSIAIPPTEMAGVEFELTCTPTDLTTHAATGVANWHWTR
jgi:YD repeat-containing protein